MATRRSGPASRPRTGRPRSPGRTPTTRGTPRHPRGARPQARHSPQDRNRAGTREHPPPGASPRPGPGTGPRGHRLPQGHTASGRVPGPHLASPAAHGRPARVPGRGGRRGAGPGHRRLRRRDGPAPGTEPAAAGGRAEGVAALVPGAVTPGQGVAPLHRSAKEDLPAATPGRRHPGTSRSCPDDGTRQDPWHHRRRGAGRGRDAATERPARRPRPKARPVGLRPRRDPPPAGLQDQLVRLPPRRGRPLLPVEQDLPCLRAGAGHRVGLALDLRAVRGASHQRDDNAAVNLARYEPPAPGDSTVGPVRAAVKRRADRKAGPRPAGGHEARKGRSHTAAEQPRDGVPA
jgi:hypothetical protein